MTNFSYEPFLFNSLNCRVPTFPMMPLHPLPSKPYEPISFCDECTYGFYATTKKIKHEEYYSNLGKSQLQLKSSIEPSRSTQKQLLIKGHSYNFKGFSDRSCSNIRIVTIIKNNLTKESNIITQKPIHEGYKKTQKEGDFVQNAPLEYAIDSVKKIYFGQSIQNINKEEASHKYGAKSGGNKEINHLINQIKMKQDINDFMRNTQNINHQDKIKAYCHLIEQKKLKPFINTYPKVCDNKPLSVTAQTYIQQKLFHKSQGILENSQ